VTTTAAPQGRAAESARRQGGVVVIAGPDGSGKSTLCSALPAAAFAEAPVLHLHHRFRVLPQRAVIDVDITRPQEQRPYPSWLSWAKSVYLFVDYQLGWQVRVRKFVARGGWVILERGWWDIAIDQRRYRLRSSGWLLRAMGRLLPRPDLVIILTAPAHTLRSRKAELSSREIERQLQGWTTVLPGNVSRTFIDVTQSSAGVVASAVDSIRLVTRKLHDG
jgi:energy-coupling factor transporter ATP-binding protein EcfA2